MYRNGDAIHLLHVVPEPSMIHVWPGMYVPLDDDAEQGEVDDAVKMIRRRFTRQLKSSKIPCQVHVAVAGTETDHLAKLINEKAEELDASCIVMASHGKTGFQVRLLLLVTLRSICASSTTALNLLAIAGVLVRVNLIKHNAYQQQTDLHHPTISHCALAAISHCTQLLADLSPNARAPQSSTGAKSAE